jgi:chromosome segregation ATPase
MGLGLCAVLSVGANTWRTSTYTGPDKYPASVRLLEAVFNPEFISLNKKYEIDKKQLADTEQKLSADLAEQKKATETARADAEKSQKTLEELQQVMPAKLSEAAKTAADAKVAELQPALDLKAQENDALKGKLAASEARVNELIEARKQLDDTLAVRVKEVTELRQKLKESMDKVDSLQTKLKAVTPVELPNPPQK